MFKIREILTVPLIPPPGRPALPFCIVATALMVMFQSVSSAWADTISLPPVADTALRNGTSADTSFGVANSLPVGVSIPGGTVNHALLRFQIGNIPANVTVTQVTLQVIPSGGNPSTANFSLFRVLKNWNETETTWNTRVAPLVTWGLPGGQAGIDYVNTASVTALFAPAPTTSRFSSLGMLADVQLWQTQSETNFGWILIADNELPGSGKQIASRESTLNGTVLIINYSPPLPPVLDTPSLVDSGFRFSFSSMSNRTYVVEFTSSLSPTNWLTLTNIAAKAADSTIQITNIVEGAERYFRVRSP